MDTPLKCITAAFQCPLSSSLHVKTALTLNSVESGAGAKRAHLQISNYLQTSALSVLITAK